jgi:hypothetical protein
MPSPKPLVKIGRELRSPLDAFIFCVHPLQLHRGPGGADLTYHSMSETVTALVRTEPRFRGHQFKPGLHPAPPKSGPLLGLTASTSTPTRRCPVCLRAACSLKSHKHYARSRGLAKTTTPTNDRKAAAGLSRSSSVGSSESHERLYHPPIEIDAATVDSFIHFPLPKGVKAEVHQLFQDCKSTTSNFAGFSFPLGTNCLFYAIASHQTNPPDTG